MKEILFKLMDTISLKTNKESYERYFELRGNQDIIDIFINEFNEMFRPENQIGFWKNEDLNIDSDEYKYAKVFISGYGFITFIPIEGNKFELILKD